MVATALAAADGGDAKLLGVTGTHLERARAANAAVVGAPILPAWERFTGVVWGHLDVSGLDPDARQRASERIVVVSALAGLSGMDDPLPDHRLKMSANLTGFGNLPSVGKLANLWRPVLSPVLNAAVRGGLVVDLLPAEHAASWDADLSTCELVRVDLIDAAGRRAGHAAKAAKGRLAAELVAAPNRKAVAELLDGTHRVDGFTVRAR